VGQVFKTVKQKTNKQTNKHKTIKGTVVSKNTLIIQMVNWKIFCFASMQLLRIIFLIKKGDN
jgi:hypothetical protein